MARKGGDFVDRISIHALLAESDEAGTDSHAFGNISIHALLAESDDSNNFYADNAVAISIHALLAESDTRMSTESPPYSNFNPRSPCGERRDLSWTNDGGLQFQSTLSLRRAT